MDILESLQWRYAVKKFDNSKIIDETKINKLTEAFNLTATSFGLQPIRLLVVKNKTLQSKMKEVSFNQEQVSTASHVLVFCIEDKLDKDFIDNYFNQMESLRPDESKEVNQYRNVILERFKNKTSEEIKLWATKQAYIALGNLLTVCAVEKIDSCPMEGFIPSKMNAVLDLKAKNLSSVLLLPIGIRTEDDQNAEIAKVRRPISDIIEHIF